MADILIDSCWCSFQNISVHYHTMPENSDRKGRCRLAFSTTQNSITVCSSLISAIKATRTISSHTTTALHFVKTTEMVTLTFFLQWNFPPHFLASLRCYEMRIPPFLEKSPLSFVRTSLFIDSDSHMTSAIRDSSTILESFSEYIIHRPERRRNFMR